MADGVRWRVEGDLVSACNCEFGCPCNFNASPTDGRCNGTYVWCIQQGNFGDVRLDGLYMGLAAESPGPIHEGHMVAQAIIDSMASDREREALLKLVTGEVGGPFAVFASVTETFLDPIYARFAADIRGLDSRIVVVGVFEMGLTTVKNQITGDREDVKLIKATGFTSLESDLGATTVYRYSGGFRHDHSGKYGEYAHFEYSGP